MVASGALRSGQPYAYYLQALGEEYGDAGRMRTGGERALMIQ